MTSVLHILLWGLRMSLYIQRSESLCLPTFVAKCLYKRFDMGYTKTGYKSLLLFRPTDGNTQGICQELEEVKKCLHLISIKDCPFFAGMMEALRYLCGNGFTRFIRSRKCLETTALATKIKTCENMLHDNVDMFYMNTSTKLAGVIHGRHDVMLDDPESSNCVKMEKVEKCVAEKVKKDCGSSAAKFQTRFVKHMFKPELAISCDQEPHGSERHHCRGIHCRRYPMDLRDLPVEERRILTNRIRPDSDSSDDSHNGGRTDPSDETDESDLTDPSDETDESDQTDPSDETDESDEPRFFSDEDDDSDESVEVYTYNHENGGKWRSTLITIVVTSCLTALIICLVCLTYQYNNRLNGLTKKADKPDKRLLPKLQSLV